MPQISKSNRGRQRGAVCRAELLEERVLMAMSLKLGGSGYSNLLATDSAALRQQKLIIDPPEPLAGSVSTLYDAAKVTIVGASPGPGFDNPDFTAMVGVRSPNGPFLQPLDEFLVRPAGVETGYVQVRFRLTGQPGKILPPTNWLRLDVDGTDGLDPASIDFLVHPDVSSDNLFKYRSYAAREGEHGNPEDFLITNDGSGTRLGPVQLAPADATNRPTDGSIVGTVFEDLNGDRELAGNDRGMPDVIVYLDLDRDGKLGDNEPSQPTNELGGFVFDDLPPGEYLVREETPREYLQTSDAEGTGRLVRVRAGDRERLYFGNARPATVSGFVFNDQDNDGVRDPGEPGLAGAVVYLDLNNDGARNGLEPFTTSADPNGAWLIGGLLPRSYVVRQVPPAGFDQSAPAAGSFTVTVSSGSTAGNLVFGDFRRPGPKVLDVFVRSSGWSFSFMKELVRLGLGDQTAGFRLTAGRVPMLLPWVNLDRVYIRFDQPVNVGASDLRIDGVKNGNSASASSPTTGFDSYVFSLRRPLGGDGSAPFNGDRLVLVLDGDPPAGVTARTGGLYLDGDSDGVPGGDFRLPFNILEGDVNRSGVVNVNDYVDTRRRLGSSVDSTPRYSVFSDVNGSGAINAADALLVRARSGRSLPAVQVPVAALAISLPLRPARRDLFGEQLVIS